MAQPVVFDYKKLSVRVFEVLGSKRALAKALGISEVTMSQKFNQKRKFSTEDILEICKVLDISADQIGDYFFTTKETN